MTKILVVFGISLFSQQLLFVLVTSHSVIHSNNIHSENDPWLQMLVIILTMTQHYLLPMNCLQLVPSFEMKLPKRERWETNYSNSLLLIIIYMVFLDIAWMSIRWCLEWYLKTRCLFVDSEEFDLFSSLGIFFWRWKDFWVNSIYVNIVLLPCDKVNVIGSSCQPTLEWVEWGNGWSCGDFTCEWL